MNNFNSVELYLEHAGKKGMKWGVRRYNRAQNQVNVGQGKAYAGVGVISLAKNKGSFKKASLAKGKASIARNDRVQNGKASIADKLKYAGGTKFSDLMPTSRSKSSTKSSIGAAVGAGILLNVGLAVLKAKSSS
jgi:hypothetical protein